MTQPPPTLKAIVTDAMLDAGRSAVRNASWDGPINELLTAIYTAMHAASPDSEIMREALEPHRKAIQRALVAISRNRPSVEDTNLARRELNAVHEYLSSICKGEREGG